MGKVTFNKEQIDAIYEDGQNILVSASAGSGKTTVLIERIIQKIKKADININELLIVTFTEAAANEMKQRLRVKLNKEIVDDPTNKHLRKQLILLPNANISTFHSFCNSVIGKFFYTIDAQAKYQVGEDVETFLLIDKAMEELFLELYEKEDKSFILLVNRFTKNTNDDNLKTIVVELYNKIRSIPFKDQFINEVISNYDLDDSLKSWRFYYLIENNINKLITKGKMYFNKAYKLATMEDVEHDYQKIYQDDYEICKTIDTYFKRNDYNKLYIYLKNVEFKRFKSSTKKDVNKITKELIKQLRDNGKKTIEKLQSCYFGFTEETNVLVIKENKEVFESLVHLVRLFEERFKSLKKERNLVDFGDLEEMALKILMLNNFDNEATSYYQATFKEILVDEFQDTNSLQETIINAVSKQNNKFMVGDVKQSIYRFRNAEPDIFQKKYKEYQKDKGLLINLNDNYRSRKEIINFINFIFKQIMDEENFEIDYDEKAELKFGQKGYINLDDELIALNLLDLKKINENEDKKYEKLEVEAHFTAIKINELIEDKSLVYDNDLKELRPIKYKDIVILSRSIKNEQAVFNDVFKHYNIPLLTQELTGYFDSIEVATITSILKIIDNPLQDIPLIASLRSPLFNINEKELIELKIIEKTDNYYEKVIKYVKTGQDNNLIDKLRYFINCLQKWREATKNESISELIYNIYHETNYYDFVFGQIGGKQRQANLDLLYNRAKQYEKVTSNSLFNFVNLINFLKNNDKDLNQARTVSENEDLVRFMSIHKSKGLEFKVVFIVNLNKEYNTSDEKTQVLFDKDLGVAFSYIDLQSRVKYDTLYQQLIKDKLRKQMLAEEMRLLYVAMTRAKERLYLVGCMKDFDKEINKYFDLLSFDEIILPDNKREVIDYLSLVVLALTRHPEFTNILGGVVNNSFLNAIKQLPKCNIKIIENISFNNQFTTHKQHFNSTKSKYQDIIEDRLNFNYLHKDKTTHFAKQTISDIKRRQLLNEFSYNDSSQSFNTPKFISKNKMNGTLRGTGYHIFMQHIPYDLDLNIDDLKDLLNQLIIKDIFTKEQASLIDLGKINKYLASDIVKSFKSSLKIHKEMPFTTLVNSSSVYNDYQENDVDILIQGVMDLLIEFNDEVYLIDFKSDRVFDTIEDINKLKEQYHTQLDFYKNAVGKLYQEKRIKAFLYLIEIDKFIEI